MLLLLTTGSSNQPLSVVQVPQKSIDNYEKYKMGQANPEDSAWVKFGETYFAVGFLAKKNFHTVHCLESLKVDSAIPQTLALVGSVAQKKALPSRFSLSPGILLFWNEFREREKFESQIATALADYTFRGHRLSVQLESLTALPEGGGIFASRWQDARTSYRGSYILINRRIQPQSWYEVNTSFGRDSARDYL